MRCYKIRHFITMFVLLALPAVTCGVGPVVLDLIERVEVLEAESDAQFLVMDSLGAEVGTRRGATVGGDRSATSSTSEVRYQRCY